MNQDQLTRLRDNLDELGRRPVRLPAWDAYILGQTVELTHEIVGAREAARRELARWRSGRFPSLALAVADAVFSKQKDYAVAVRTATRPFAQTFAAMPIDEFCAFDRGNMFRLTFGKEPRPGKERAHLAPEGRIRTIHEACGVLRDAGLDTPAAARAALAIPPAIRGLDQRLTRVFGFGDAMLANLRMNVGVLTVKPDVHVRRYLAPLLGLTADASSDELERSLSKCRDAIGMEPFEVDQLIWYTKAASGRPT